MKRILLIIGTFAVLCSIFVIPSYAASAEVSGVWEFNEVLSSVPEGIANNAEISAAFTWEGESYTAFRITYDTTTRELTVLGARAGSGVDPIYSSGTWQGSRVVEFSEPVTLSEPFSEWFIANAEKVPPDMPTLLDSVGDFVSSAVSWTTQFLTFVAQNPLVLLYVLLPLVGLGIGLLSRLFRVN